MHRKLRLRHLLIAPGSWAMHFLLSYVSVAVICAKLAPGNGELWLLRPLLALYAIAALTLQASCALYARRALQEASEAQHGFLARLSLTLAGLSAVATVYTALPMFFIASCR